MAATTTATNAWTTLQPLLRAYQEEDDEDEPSSTTVDQFVRVLLQQQDAAENSAALLLRRILDATLLAASSSNSSSSSSSSCVARCLALVVALANHCAEWQSATVERLGEFASSCPEAEVRARAVQTLGQFVAPLSEQILRPCLEGKEEEQQRTLLLDVLDRVQQTVVAAFTDKAVVVRAAAVTAGAAFQGTDPDVQQGQLWILQHDPSASNRAHAALQLTVDLTTVSPLVHRLRDTAPAVRLAVLQALGNGGGGSNNKEDGTAAMTAASSIQMLQSHHLAVIVMNASAMARCPATQKASRDWIRHAWLPAAVQQPDKSNNVVWELLRQLDVVAHPEAAQVLVEVLRQEPTESEPETEEVWRPEAAAAAADDFTLEDLSSWLKDSSNKEKDVDKNNNDVNDYNDYTLERLFWARAVAANDDMVFSKVVPEMPVYCRALESAVTRLVQVMADEAEMEEDRPVSGIDEQTETDRLVFGCQQLLQLATDHAATGGMEEGSRRLLVQALKSLLVNRLTPDDLVPGAVRALQAVVVVGSGNAGDVWSELAAQVMQELQEPHDDSSDADNDNDDAQQLQAHGTLRMLSVLAVVLESSATSALVTGAGAAPIPAHLQQQWADDIVLPALDSSNGNDGNSSNKNPWVRQAAVRCLGLLGLWASPAARDGPYGKTLRAVALNEAEDADIRAQALLAWTDWSRLPSTSDAESDTQLKDQVSRLLLSPPPTESSSSNEHEPLRRLAAEMAVKLLLSGKVCDSEWLAALVVLFFAAEDVCGSNDSDEDDYIDVTEIGSPVRLPQLLAIFFPAVVAQSRELRHAWLASIGPLLERTCLGGGGGGKKKKKTPKTPGVAKMIDFVVSTAERAMEQEQSKEQLPTGKQEEGPESSPGLRAAVQVAIFLSEHAAESDSWNTTTLRALCKVIAGVGKIVVEHELYDDLSLLKELLDELTEGVVDDEPALQSLAGVMEQLREVEMEEEVEEEEDDDEEELDAEEAVAKHRRRSSSSRMVGAKENQEQVAWLSEDEGDDDDDDDESVVVSKTEAVVASSPSSSTRRSSGRRLRPSN